MKKTKDCLEYPQWLLLLIDKFIFNNKIRERIKHNKPSFFKNKFNR